MLKSKTIDLLSTFSEDEFKKFGLYLMSPLFNREKVIVKTYGAIKYFYPEFNSAGFTKEKIFSKLYPGKEYNDSMMRNILSKLLECAKNFLSINRYCTNEFYFSFGKVSELNKRRQQKLFRDEEEYINTLMQTAKYKDEEYYYRNYLLDNERRKFNLNLKSSVKHTEYSLENIADNLTLSFMINALKNYTYLMNTNKYAYHYEENKMLIDGVENYINLNYEKLINETHLIYWFNTYMLAKTRSEEHYKRLYEILNNNLDNLNYSEQHNIFTILANYAYTKINEGDLSYLKEQFKIYKKNLEKGLYKAERKFFSHILFINIVVIALESGETDWSNNFINKYKTELDDLNRDNTYIFCKSLIYYHTKNYNEAIESAAKVQTDDLSYKHQLKSLYLKIYFDLNESEPFYSHLDSYKHFIANEKNLSENALLTITNYVNFSKKLFDIKNNFENKEEFDLVKLKDEIIKNKAMINKPWLLRKIEEIKNLYN